MAEEKIIEGEATEIPKSEKEEKKALDAAASAAAIRDTVGSWGKAVTSALQDRANVVMVRVNDEALRHMDMLVEAEVTKSRSESAAFLITEGIKANQALYKKIGTLTDQIADLRTQLRDIVNPEPKK
jgi:hypothetical protein